MDMPSANNPKSLQSRRSLLDLLQSDKTKPISTSSLPSSSNTSLGSDGTLEEPLNKRPKMDDNGVCLMVFVIMFVIIYVSLSG